MVASTARAASDWTHETAPVLGIVRRAWRAIVLRRAIESFVIGVAACLVCFAASVASGGDLTATNAWIAACAVGSLAALSWWLEHALEESAVARRLDTDGALLTAYECERSDTSTPIGALLSRRVASALAVSRPRFSLAPSPLILAGVLGAGALLALAVESADAPGRVGLVDGRRRAFAASVATLAEAVEGATESGSTMAAAELRALVRSAERLADERGSATELAVFAGQAEEAARERPDGSPVRDALDQAADAARALAADSGNTGPAPGGTSATGTASDRGVGEAGSGTDMRSRTSDVTMLRPDPGAARDPAAGAADERGLPAVRWWPRRFDAIVERWALHQRASGDR